MKINLVDISIFIVECFEKTWKKIKNEPASCLTEKL